MSNIVKVAIAVVLLASTGAILYFGGQRILEQQRTTREVTRLRDELYRARVTAERCQQSNAASEGALQAFDARLDSMRTAVEGYEQSEGRVAASRYDEYIERFERYNDSVEVWEAQERALRAADQACREVILEHNELSDSLQSVLAAAGIEVE